MLPSIRSSVALAALAAGAASQSTVRVSVSTSGAQTGGASLEPVISANGRFVAFESFASNLVADDTNHRWDVFVHDRQTGVTRRVSVATDGTQGSGNSRDASISADGRFVAFVSDSTTLVPGDTNGYTDIFVRDRQLVVTRRVSVHWNGAQSNGVSSNPSVSPDGRYVAFESVASNLIGFDTNGWQDVFLHELATLQTTRVSTGSFGQSDGGSGEPSFSGRGEFLVFRSWATNFVPGDTSNDDVFVRDLASGLITVRSVDSSGSLGNGDSVVPAITRDARFVAFASVANDLVPGDTNVRDDVFVNDRVSGRTVRVSVGPGEAQGDESAYWPSMSDDGRFVCYRSRSTNLVAGDTNGSEDVFVHDLLLSETTRVSVDSSGGQGNSGSSEPWISADGRFVAFESSASNLVAGDTNGTIDIFVRDRFGADPPRVFCAGDGSGTPCPCPSTEPWHGCSNSAFPSGGALLLASGTASVAADSIELRATRIPPGEVAVLFQAPGAQDGAPGVIFDDGVLCLRRPLQRLTTRTATSGSVTYGPSAGDPPLSQAGGIPSGGGRFLYQLWYRDAAPACTPASANLTNGLEIVWTP